MVAYEDIFNWGTEYLRCEVLEVKNNEFDVKLVDYGLTKTVSNLYPQDKEHHAGPDWVRITFHCQKFNNICLGNTRSQTNQRQL